MGPKGTKKPSFFKRTLFRPEKTDGGPLSALESPFEPIKGPVLLTEALFLPRRALRWNAKALCLHRFERALFQSNGALFRSFFGFRGPFIGLKGPSFDLRAFFGPRGSCVGLKVLCMGRRRAVSSRQRTLSDQQRPSFCLKEISISLLGPMEAHCRAFF